MILELVAFISTAVLSTFFPFDTACGDDYSEK